MFSSESRFCTQNIAMYSSRKYLDIVLPPQKGLEFPGGGGSVRPKDLKKYMKLNRNFQRGGGGLLEKIPSVGRYGNFLKLHNND